MNIAVNNLQTKIPIPYLKIRTIAVRACKILGLSKKKTELSIVFVGEQRMRSLNKNFLGHDYVTDILTFDLKDTAELIICPKVALKNSKIHVQSLAQELVLYTIHGLLHLAGFDDHSPNQIKRMRAAERRLLSKIL